MKNHVRMSKYFAAVAGISALASIGTANAAVSTLVLDTFQASPSTSNALAGSTADIGGTWAPLSTVSNGSTGTATAVITPPSGSTAGYVTLQTTANGNFIDNNAGIAITPASNGTLTLEANITYNAASEWAAIGFAPSATTVDAISNAEPWALINTSTGGYQLFEGPGTANKAMGVTSSTYTGTTTVEMTYNLASGAVALSLGNGANASSLTQVGQFTYATLPTAPGAIFIALRGDQAPATFSNLSLTQVATPEPASLAVFAAGSAGLLLLSRRRLTSRI